MTVLVAVPIDDLDGVDPCVQVTHHELITALGGVQDHPRAPATGDDAVRTRRGAFHLDNVVIEELSTLAAQERVEDRRYEHKPLVGEVQGAVPSIPAVLQVGPSAFADRLARSRFLGMRAPWLGWSTRVRPRGRSRSSAACTSASARERIGSRPEVWLHAVRRPFSVIGYESGTVRSFSRRLPMTRCSTESSSMAMGGAYGCAPRPTIVL